MRHEHNLSNKRFRVSRHCLRDPQSRQRLEGSPQRRARILQPVHSPLARGPVEMIVGMGQKDLHCSLAEITSTERDARLTALGWTVVGHSTLDVEESKLPAAFLTSLKQICKSIESQTESLSDTIIGAKCQNGKEIVMEIVKRVVYSMSTSAARSGR